MKPTTNYLKTFLTFSKSERNGILVLLILLIGIVITIKLLTDDRRISNNNDFQAFQREIDSLFAESDTIKKELRIRKITASFPKKTDKKVEIIPVDINNADSVGLIRLPGIGPVLASRIIKFRKLTGGFYRKDQLLEVYGLQEENYLKAKPYIIINTGNLTMISADTANFKMMAKHPYIGKDKAWQIINLRKKKKFVPITPEELKDAQIFDSLQWGKVNNYLVFQNN
jgi:DNA uptake protein ComE-like DNA-binding protein